MKRAAGFTMIELVAIIVIIGILAAVAVPRMDTSGYRALEFHDRTVAALRYAQKSATSHRRQACVAFTATTVTLTIAQANPGGCTQPLLLPGGSTNVVQSGDPANAAFSPVPADFSFQPAGTGADRTLTIAGQAPITVVGASGHVQ